jgi:hypothetical protein
MRMPHVYQPVTLMTLLKAGSTRSEKTAFECECVTKLTLADRAEEGTPAVGQMIRGSIRAYGP